MTGSDGIPDYLKIPAVRDAITHIAEVNHLSGYEKGWMPKGHTDPNAVAEHKGHSLFISNLALTAFAIVIVSGRIYARAFVAGGLGGDDYAMVGAAVRYSGRGREKLSGLVLMVRRGIIDCFDVFDGDDVLRQAGIGKHLLDLELDEILDLLKISYAMPIVHTLGLYPIKMSLLLFYRRLFGPNLPLQRVVRLFMIFETIHTFGSCIGFTFMCTPIHSWWNIFRRAEDCPTLRETMAIYVGVRAVSVLTDILVVLLPMKLVWDLKASVKEKIGLATVFGLGVMLLLSLDIPRNIVPVSLLGWAEQCLGMITASIPALTALISNFGTSYALSGPGMSNHAAQDIDLLAYAYDPDGVNVVYTTVYAGNPPRCRGRTTGFSDDNLVEEGGGRWLEPNTISKTTTVEVKVALR
ncbi:hypothetical protein C7212DRAFT_365278 [Tuber magnatum]|uniref:Rhodopsin domain-containing protein n=1 Tax=Tuber magnatum TaxID=42249 RepID=A0A317SM39_9PEZI|nr:hypothetical protein C7212DRAFT_365278 [Tuber magnatum]